MKLLNAQGRSAQQAEWAASLPEPSRDGWAPSAHWRSMSQRLVKRGLDIAGAGAALLAALPMLMLVALLIRVTSRGPILLRQRRIGKDGRAFKMYKFRTMRANSDTRLHEEYYRNLIAGSAQATNGRFKLVNDPRITGVGRIIRRFSVDELPQFVNVLKGDMSLVGPRPPLPYEVDLYDAPTRRRLLVTPGLTGLWQVSGRSALNFAQMVELDLEYIARWSLQLDLKIVLRTPLAVFFARGVC